MQVHTLQYILAFDQNHHCSILQYLLQTENFQKEPKNTDYLTIVAQIQKFELQFLEFRKCKICSKYTRTSNKKRHVMSQRILEEGRKQAYVVQLEKALCVHLTISQQTNSLGLGKNIRKEIILSFNKIFQLQQGLKICGLQDCRPLREWVLNWIHKFLKWFQRYADFLYAFADSTRILKIH